MHNRVVHKCKIMVQLFSKTCFGEALAVFILKMMLFWILIWQKFRNKNLVGRPRERARKVLHATAHLSKHMLSCSAHIITRHVLHARDPMADRQAGRSSLILTGGIVEASMKCDLTKKRFC